MSAPTYIAKGTKDEGNGLSVAPTYPGSIQANDKLYILALSVQNTPGNINSASGYSILSEESFSWGKAALMVKTATGSESGTETVGRSGSSGGINDFFMAQIYVVRGTGASLTIEDTDPNSATGNTTVTWDAVTVNGSERTLLAFVADFDGSGITTPSGYTSNAVDNSIGISGSTIQLFSKVDVSSDGVITATGSANGWSSWHLSVYNINSRSFIVN